MTHCTYNSKRERKNDTGINRNRNQDEEKKVEICTL